MTSRELVKRTFEFRNTDGRAPRDMWLLPWTMENEGEALQGIYRDFPMDYGDIHVEYRETSSVERGDPTEIGEYVDPWGCVFTNIYRGIIGEVKTPIVTDDEWADLSRVVIPEHWLSFDIEQVNQEVAATDKWTCAGCCPRPFEQLQFIRGTANLYMDLMDLPDGLKEFLEKMHDFYCRLLKKWAQTDVDSLMFMDDWGAQNRLLISPQLWRTIFKPMYRDFIDIAHSHGKKAVMHSDGYTLDIIPDLIDLGLDAMNSQIFCMGPENLSQFRGKLTFWGEVCRQNILPYGSVEDVRQAVRRVYDNLWDNGGCIAQCEFGPGAKPENVRAMYEAWNELTGG